MENSLETLEPQPLWRYFLELSRIPRGSGHEAAATAWVSDQARAMGCTVSQDAAGNVLIRKPAFPGREGAGTTALQAHVDMVCEKNEATVHDFLTDPISVVRDGDRLRARGTTLGADDGIGVAAALAVLASPAIQHGPLEVLITVSEETGLTGAKGLQAGCLRATNLLNLDSGRGGFITIGCSGGLDSEAVRLLKLRPAGPGRPAWRLKVGGLKGGHSGGAINQGRGNAIQLLARALWALLPFGWELAAVSGGDKRNAIPREASALLFLEPGQEAGLRAALAELEAQAQAALGSFDPEVVFTLESATPAGREVMTAQDARAVVAFLFNAPHGVVAESPVIPGLVQTSTNLAKVVTKAGEVRVAMSHRSSVASSKLAVADRVEALCELAGFTLRRGEGYPGWQPDLESPLARQVSATHEALFGKPMEFRATHGGLECGIIGQGHPGMRMVSFGPDMWDIHTPDESLGISSTADFWKLLGAVLETL
jgi:dipeptidase D